MKNEGISYLIKWSELPLQVMKTVNKQRLFDTPG